ncbi:MAG: PD40 domain-containing protein [Deltaproteobacteria bacterium]|nr:PD40 domain-containing protein [Deltaproteobacteria bacterium]
MTSPRTAIAVATALTLSPAAQALAPFLDWHTIESSCCTVHYPQRLLPLAQRVASIADASHATVTEFLGAVPGDRVQIVVEDETDSANGWALTVPYNTVHIFAVAPDNYSTLGDTDDWLRSLVLHEYTHIVHLDTVGGIPRLVKGLFGKLWAPNQAQPIWWIEGLAVYAESRFTSGGRVRASLYDMFLRTAALDDELWTLDELSTGKRAYPYGASSYLYGGRFLDFLARRYGEGVFRTISARYGAQLVPFGLNRAAREALDKSYDNLYAEFLAEVREQARQVRDRTQALGADASQRLTRLGNNVRQPVVGSDGTVYLYGSPRDDTPALYRYDVGRGQAQRLFELHGFEGMTALPDGTLLLAQPEVFDNAYAFYDLYRIDPRSGRSERLTRGLRGREPAALPDGSGAIFVRRDGERCALARLDLDTDQVADIRLFEDGSQFYTPAVAPDGQSAVISMWRPGGFRDLWRVDLVSGELQQLTADRALDLDPVFAPDGRLLFTSDRSGVFQIHALDLGSGRLTQLSNVVSGAFAPRPTSDGAQIYFVGFTVDGYDLFGLPAERTLDLPGSVSYERPLAHPSPQPLQLETSVYDPLPTLLPHAWIPVLTVDGAGPVLGAAVAGQDAVGVHQYTLQATYGTESGAFNADLGYGYNDLPTPVRLGVSRYEYQRQLALDLGDETAWTRERGWRIQTTLLLPRLRWLNSHVFGVGYDVEWNERVDALPFAPDQARPAVPWIGRTNALRLQWGYGDLRWFIDSISVERGVSGGLWARLAHPLLGSESVLFELFGHASLYLQVPGLTNHVVAILVQGGYATGPRDQRRLYGVGGIPARNLVEDLVLRVRLGGGYLRGYPSNAFVGDGMLVGSLEYRFPLLVVQRGLSTLPLFFDRAYAVVFGDIGGAWFDTPRSRDLLHRGAGAELRAVTVLGYVMGLELRLGVARGFDAKGLAIQPYLVIGANY